MAASRANRHVKPGHTVARLEQSSDHVPRRHAEAGIQTEMADEVDSDCTLQVASPYDRAGRTWLAGGDCPGSGRVAVSSGRVSFRSKTTRRFSSRHTG